MLTPIHGSTVLRTWILTVAAAAGYPAATYADASPGKPAADELATWVRQLDSDQYVVREAATRELQAAGEAAFDPLLSAALGDRPEAADRAIFILQRAAMSEDLGHRHEALLRLVQIDGRPHVVGPAIVALAEIDHHRALEEIQEMGARVLPRGIDKQFGTELPRRIEIDDQWRGGDDGLKRVAAVRDVTFVRILGAPVTAVGVEYLQNMAFLRTLQVYEVKLKQEEVRALKEQFPVDTFDYRRGALLGVSNHTNATTPVVFRVTPGSAAEKAGIQPNDWIMALNDQRVTSFQHLTQMIGRHNPGDEATLRIRRDREVLNVDVKFDSWLEKARPK